MGMSLAAAAGSSSSGNRYEFEEATVDAIHLGFKNGSLMSTALVRFYLDQISRLNPLLHAVIEVNPDALAQAARADAERSASCSRCAVGLHGIPVLLKDNIATRGRVPRAAREGDGVEFRRRPSSRPGAFPFLDWDVVPGNEERRIVPRSR